MQRDMNGMDDKIAELAVSPARRAFGAGVQVALGLVLVVTAAQVEGGPVTGRVLLSALGLGILVMGVRFWRQSARGLVLTKTGLFDSDGREIAALSNVAGVDRGVFALKPSNGFLIRLKTPMRRAWVPGLWWRVGRKVGVGGATPGRAARDMADMITMMTLDRNADGKGPG